MKKRRKAKAIKNGHALARQGLVVLKWLLALCVGLLVMVALQKLTQMQTVERGREYSVILAGLILVPLLLRWHPHKV